MKKPPSAIAQINAAIKAIQSAQTKKDLMNAHKQASAFIEAAYEKEDIDLSEKHKFLRKVRSEYRTQHLGANS